MYEYKKKKKKKMSFKMLKYSAELRGTTGPRDDSGWVQATPLTLHVVISPVADIKILSGATPRLNWK